MKAKFTFLMALFLLVSYGHGQSKADQANEYYNQALADYRARNLHSALENITQATNLKNNASISYLSGMIYEAMGRDLRAVAAYEATLKFDPEYYEAVFQKGLIYLNYGDPEQASRDFTLLLAQNQIPKTRGVYFATDPTGQQSTQIMSMSTLKSQIYHYRGQALMKLTKYEEAMADFNNAIATDTVADYFVSRGLLYGKMKQPGMAVSDYERAIALEPDHQLAWYNLALIKPTVDLPGELIADTSFGPTLGLLASRAMEDGRYAKAEEYFDQSIKNDPSNPLSYINRGRVLLKMGKHVEARNDFNHARSMEPTRFECLYLTGNTYFFEKDYERAVAFYNHYLTVDPQNAMVWYNGAMSYLEMDNQLDACHYLNKAHTLGMLKADEMIGKHCR